MNKSAQGISLRVIVIAAIALIVLVLLSVIFMQRMNIFTGTISVCASKGEGAKCSEKQGECPSDGQYIKVAGTECDKIIYDDANNKHQVCCVKLFD